MDKYDEKLHRAICAIIEKAKEDGQSPADYVLDNFEIKPHKERLVDMKDAIRVVNYHNKKEGK